MLKRKEEKIESSKPCQFVETAGAVAATTTGRALPPELSVKDVVLAT